MLNFSRTPQIQTEITKTQKSILNFLNSMSVREKWEGKIVNTSDLKNILNEVNLIYPNTLKSINDLRYDSKLYTQNPYNKNIQLDKITGLSADIKNVAVNKNMITSMDFHLNRFLLDGYQPIGYYSEPITIPVLTNSKGEVWMSPSLSEINSIQPYINKAHGHVCTIGLGLGYYVYMCLLKDEVGSITIVENNKEIIDIFQKFIMPQFNIDKPITIIHGDLFDYYNQTFLNKFDYVFIDTWKSNNDGLNDYYIPMMEKLIPPNHVDFWIENSILLEPQVILSTYCIHMYAGKSTQDFISSASNLNKNVAIKINRFMKKNEINISEPSDLKQLLKDKQLIREILSTKTSLSLK